MTISPQVFIKKKSKHTEELKKTSILFTYQPMKIQQ